MKYFFTVCFSISVALLASCSQINNNSSEEIEDFQNDIDNKSHYQEYGDEEFVSDEDVAGESWDVNFTFAGVINDGNIKNSTSGGDTEEGTEGDDDGGSGDSSESVTLGSGLLTYLNLLGEPISVNAASWAIKKTLTLNSGHQIPILQIFFADNEANIDEDGRVLYFILQLEGSSVSSKSETYYLNNDKLYKAKVKLNAGRIEEICYVQEPDPTKGKVNIYTHNIRIGEELKVSGYANMKDMEVKECKTMN